jgi:hypothetical protein
MTRVTFVSWVIVACCSSVLEGCAVAGPSDAPTPTPISMRDRLAAGPIRLAITGTGSVTAEHRAAGDRWVGGSAGVTVSSGELSARLEDERLVTESFDLSLEPIELPPSLFGRPASLTGVRLTLASATGAVPTWATSERASAVLELPLDLAWSITIAGGSTSLGVQHLLPVAFDVELTGTDRGVDARLEVHEAGELWSWAALVRLSNLALSLAATS